LEAFSESSAHDIRAQLLQHVQQIKPRGVKQSEFSLTKPREPKHSKSDTYYNRELKETRGLQFWVEKDCEEF
jgi:hypothetical protein